MVWFELGLQYDAISEAKLAHRCYTKSEMDPTAAETWQQLGRVYLDLKEGTRAVTAFNKAVELDPENPLMWWSLAEGYCVLNDKAQCVDGVRKVGVKLEKLVGDVQRREAELRSRMAASEEKAKAASIAMAQSQQAQSALEQQLAQAQGQVQSASASASENETQLNEAKVQKQIWEKRAAVWDQREREYKAKLEEQESGWRKKVEAAMQVRIQMQSCS